MVLKLGERGGSPRRVRKTSGTRHHCALNLSFPSFWVLIRPESQLLPEAGMKWEKVRTGTSWEACVCCTCCVLSHVCLFAIPWTVALQAPLSMGFSRQEYWSGLPFSPPGDRPNPGIKPESLASPAFAGGLFTTSATGEAKNVFAAGQIWLPGGSAVEFARQCRRWKRLSFDPWVGKIPWGRKWQPTPVLLPGESHGQRSLADYSGVT